MKVFFDSNIWIAAFGTRGLCQDLAALAIRLEDAGRLVLLTCPAIESEVQRILADKFHLTPTELDTVNKLLRQLRQVPDGSWHPPSDFPDPDDWPIINSAIKGKADLFVTGDKALLDLGTIERLPILDPRAAYLKLRGLE